MTDALFPSAPTKPEAPKKSASEAPRLYKLLDDTQKKAVVKAASKSRTWMPEFPEKRLGGRLTEPSSGGGAELVDIKLITPLPSVASNDEAELTARIPDLGNNEVVFRLGGSQSAPKAKIKVGAPLKRQVTCVRGVDYLNLAQVYDDADFDVEAPEEKAEDEAAIDRLFGTKAYKPSQSDGTITG